MISKTRQPARRQTDRRASPQVPATAPRLTQPAALDDKQLKEVAGGTSQALLPKGTW